jgi:hypothetical protein
LDEQPFGHKSVTPPGEDPPVLAIHAAPAPFTFRLPAATYRRRRFVAGLLLAAVVLAAVVGVSWLTRPAAGELDLRPVAREQVVVQPGDTVWSIAQELAAGGDVRPLVDAIVAANGGAELAVGQRLTVSVP